MPTTQPPAGIWIRSSSEPTVAGLLFRMRSTLAGRAGPPRELLRLLTPG
ncbi:Uncharacterised protein [Mycobacteroides abscessus]|nr:Uncharacterised protein [Mycobacteroides abscessus]